MQKEEKNQLRTACSYQKGLEEELEELDVIRDQLEELINTLFGIKKEPKK